MNTKSTEQPNNNNNTIPYAQKHTDILIPQRRTA